MTRRHELLEELVEAFADKPHAAEAVAEFTAAEDPQGWEVVIPRRVEAGELHRVRHLPQVVGWRFFPESKGMPVFCTCRFCTRGEYGSR